MLIGLTLIDTVRCDNDHYHLGANMEDTGGDGNGICDKSIECSLMIKVQTANVEDFMDE